ncbi:MAG TPA: deoxyribose-phosphate aldolase [Aminobacteriaceae bacterium]|nr:deoxyribose-phosphate aldolase [Aminobacteriaceae bacterium]
MKSREIAKYIDHTLLKPEASEEAVRKLCAEARDFGFASVCVNGGFTELVARELKGSDVKTCVVIGFPLGAGTSAAKAFEAADAVSRGAEEIDMVISVGRLRSGETASVREDIRAVVQAAEGALVKVIIETCLLTDEQKELACRLAEEAGAHFVKTSTGFSTGGATAEDVALMRRVVGDRLGVKASGGIRTREDAERMIAAGASRIGASASVAICAG